MNLKILADEINRSFEPESHEQEGEILMEDGLYKVKVLHDYVIQSPVEFSKSQDPKDCKPFWKVFEVTCDDVELNNEDLDQLEKYLNQ